MTRKLLKVHPSISGNDYVMSEYEMTMLIPQNTQKSALTLKTAVHIVPDQHKATC